MKIQPVNTNTDNKYKMHTGNLNLLIDELGEFIDNWYMAPTSVMECLEQAHISACSTRYTKGKVPSNITDYRTKSKLISTT